MAFSGVVEANPGKFLDSLGHEGSALSGLPPLALAAYESDRQTCVLFVLRIEEEAGFVVTSLMQL